MLSIVSWMLLPEWRIPVNRDRELSDDSCVCCHLRLSVSFLVATASQLLCVECGVNTTVQFTVLVYAIPYYCSLLKLTVAASSYHVRRTYTQQSIQITVVSYAPMHTDRASAFGVQ